jgi:4-amino-4-deoxy-L-arabinose transferase-like glycosyltransferase
MKTGNRQVAALNSPGADGAVGFGETVVAKVRENLPAIVFWCSAVFILFWSLGVKGLWGPEDRWAEVVREMRLTGDYFHPMINGKPYFDKPLLGYWLIALFAAVTGRLDEGIVRLPSAIAGVLALGAMISLGRKLWSKSMARVAGWILLGSYGFVFWARTGEADMENMAAIILAVAWYWHRREKPGFLSYVVFYLICFLGAQTKGMATIAVPILVILPDLIRQRRWRSHVSVAHGLALLVGLSVYLVPFAFSDTSEASYHASGLGLAIRENIIRYIRPFDHEEPFYVYFYDLPKLLFPWIPLFIGAIWLSCARFKKLDWPSQWLVIATALVFLFFTLCGSRRSYYILPILPFCALMVSLYLTVEAAEPLHLMLDIQRWVFIVILAAEILSPLIWLVVRSHVSFTLSGLLLVATLCLGALALGGLIVGRIRPARLTQILGAQENVVGLIATCVLIMGGFFCWQDQLLNAYRSEKPFSMALKSRAQSVGAGQIAFFRKFSIKTLFYMDLPEPVTVLDDVDEVKPFLNSTKETRILVSRYDYHNELAGVLPEKMMSRPTLKEKAEPWQKDKKYEAWIITD